MLGSMMRINNIITACSNLKQETVWGTASV